MVTWSCSTGQRLRLVDLTKTICLSSREKGTGKPVPFFCCAKKIFFKNPFALREIPSMYKFQEILENVDELKIEWRKLAGLLEFDKEDYIKSAKTKLKLRPGADIDCFMDASRRLEVVAFFDEAIKNGIVNEDELEKQPQESSEDYFQRITGLVNDRLPYGQGVFYSSLRELCDPLDLVRIETTPYEINIKRLRPGGTPSPKQSDPVQLPELRRSVTFQKAGLVELENGREVWFVSSVEIFNLGPSISEDANQQGAFKFTNLCSRDFRARSREKIQEDLGLSSFNRRKFSSGCFGSCCKKIISADPESPKSLLAYIEVSAIYYGYCATLSLPGKVNVLNIPGSIVNFCTDGIADNIKSQNNNRLIETMISKSCTCVHCDELLSPRFPLGYPSISQIDGTRNPVLNEYMQIGAIHENCENPTIVRNCSCGAPENIVVNGVPYCQMCAKNTVLS